MVMVGSLPLQVPAHRLQGQLSMAPHPSGVSPQSELVHVVGEQLQVAFIHVSGGVQSVSSRQQPATGVPVHVPSWQVSASVHAFPSVQLRPFVAARSHVSRSEPFSQIRLPVLAQSPVPHIVAVGT